MMCSGASWDTKQLVATVRKAGDKKAFINLEKKGQTEYVLEGDLVQRNYTVKLSNAQVAQVSYLSLSCFKPFGGLQFGHAHNVANCAHMTAQASLHR